MSKHHSHRKDREESKQEEPVTVYSDRHRYLNDNPACLPEIKPFMINVIKGDQGCTGEMGPRGHKGSSGKRGKRGKPGKDGCEGPPGCEGPQGPQGECAPLPRILDDFAFGQNTVEQILQPNQPVVFLPGLLNSGVTYDNILNEYNLSKAGVYKVSYYVQSPNVTEMALLVNAVVLPESVYSVLSGINVGQVVFTTPFDDAKIALINTLSVAVTLPVLAVANSTQTARNVSIIIERMTL